MMIAERKNTRGRIEILASILFHCREGIKKTHIMSKANVGYEQLCYYLPNLIDTDLVKQDIDDGSVVYRTTDLGREFLKSYYHITNLLNYHNKDCQNLDQCTSLGTEAILNRQTSTWANRQLVSIIKESES
jgi:predicted transcriptional regulator